MPPSTCASVLLTARAVADELGVSTRTVLRWTQAGILPGFRLPSGALRYREDDLREWVAERATTVDSGCRLRVSS